MTLGSLVLGYLVARLGSSEAGSLRVPYERIGEETHKRGGSGSVLFTQALDQWSP